jgi:hypothetical protein
MMSAVEGRESSSEQWEVGNDLGADVKEVTGRC